MLSDGTVNSQMAVLLDESLEGLDERTYVRLLDELPPLLAVRRDDAAGDTQP